MLEIKSLPSAVDDAADVMAHFQRGAKKTKNLALQSLATLLLSVLALLVLTTFFTN
jgi:hypothetical protein